MILQHEREATCHCGMNMSCAGLSRPLEVFVLQSWHLDLDPAVWTCPDSSLETGNCMRSFGMTLSQSPTHPGTIPMPPNSAPRWNGGRDWAYFDVFWLHVLSMQRAMRFCMFSPSNYNVLECPIMLASSPHWDILHHVHLWKTATVVRRGRNRPFAKWGGPWGDCDGLTLLILCKTASMIMFFVIPCAWFCTLSSWRMLKDAEGICLDGRAGQQKELKHVETHYIECLYVVSTQACIWQKFCKHCEGHRYLSERFQMCRSSCHEALHADSLQVPHLHATLLRRTGCFESIQVIVMKHSWRLEQF